MRLLCTLLFLLAVVSGGMAAPLPKDPLLDKPVTVEAKKRPVGPLLADLSKQSGAKLSVEKALGAWTFTLYVHRCPLRDVMAGMATSGALGWVPDGKGAYRLTIPGIMPPPMEMAKFMAALNTACPVWMRPKPGEQPATPRRGEGPTLGDRIYASLPEAARRRLEMGEEIPFPELPVEARKAAIESRQSMARWRVAKTLGVSWDFTLPGLSLQVVSGRWEGTRLRLVAPAEKGPDGKPLPPSPGEREDAPAGWRTLHDAGFSVATPSDGVPAPPMKDVSDVALPVAREGGLNVAISTMHPSGVREPQSGTPVEKMQAMIPERRRDWYRWEKVGSVWALSTSATRAWVRPGTPDLARARRSLQSALPPQYASLLTSSSEARLWQPAFGVWSRLWDSLADEQRKGGKPTPLAELSAEQRRLIEAGVQADLAGRAWEVLSGMLGYDVQKSVLVFRFDGQHEGYQGLGCPRSLRLCQGEADLVYDLLLPSLPPLLPLLPGDDAALGKRVGLVAKGEPAAIVAGRLGTALGVKMSAPPGVGKRLAGEFRGKPARLVLHWIERQTGMQWVKEGAAYVLRPCWNLDGRVADGEGKAVAGARVTVQSGADNRRASCTTDAGGRFRLSGLSPGAAFLFADKEGFRFHGQVLPSGAASAEVKLVSANLPSEPLRSLTGALPAQEETALALRLVQPILDRISREGLKETESGMHEALMRLAPARMQAGSEKANKGEMSDVMRSRLADRLITTSPDEALALVEAIKDAHGRAYGYVKAVDALLATEAARKAELLATALASARAIKEPQYRTSVLPYIGERLLLMGKTEMATAVLREGEALAKVLPTANWAGYARGVLAESLSLIDLPSALDLIKGIADKFDHDRHHGNIAHKLAGRRPADAERVLSMLRDEHNRDRLGARVCYRMAPVDLPRAQRVAEAIKNPYERAFARGIMAHALAAADKATAEKLLREAFDALAKLAQSRGSDSRGGWYSSAAIAGALLPAAEAIDPRLVREFLWRAVACQCERSGRDLYQEGKPDASLAMMIARYDLDVARAVLEPALAPDTSQDTHAYAQQRGQDALHAAAAVVDPARAVTMVEALPEDPDTAKSYNRKKDRARAIVAGVLSLRGEERWQMLQGKYLHLWVIDKEDL